MTQKISKFRRYFDHNKIMLQNIIKSYFQFENIPDTIDERYLKKLLITESTPAAFIYKGDLVVSDGAASGLDIYYRPTTFTPANPYITGGVRYTIGVDCTVCYLSEVYTRPFNFNQLVNIYASRLADIDISIDTSVKNSRVTNIMIVDDANEAIRTGKMMEEIYNDGAPSVFSFKTSFNRPDGAGLYPIKARDNIVTSELADARRNVLADFYAYLGIDTIAVDKKERTNLDEMSSNKQQLKISSDIWLDNINLWCDDTNAMFGTDIHFKLNTAPQEANKEVVNDD